MQALDPADQFAQIRALQRSAGNRGVALLIGSWARSSDAAADTGVKPHVQRCGADRCCPECATRADRIEQEPDLDIVQRQPDAGAPEAGRPDAGAPPDAGVAASPSITYLTVRDPSIGLGGRVVPDLESVKAAIMAQRRAADWNLVIAIHGSQNRLGAQSPPDWQKDAKFYGEADIKALFGADSAFVNWRDQFGPWRIVLLGCQVGAPFEQVVADNLTRGGSGARAQGLGEGCKPITRTETPSWGVPGKEKPVSSRAEFERLEEAGKQWVLEELRKLNEKWGYLGTPPVPNGELLRYYFDEEPRGAWAIVEVHKDVSGTLTPLGVPFWNRMSNSTFLRSCSMGVGTLGPRTTP